MKAITVVPREAGSARLEDFAEPDARNGTVLVEAIAVGVCGTDVEFVEGVPKPVCVLFAPSPTTLQEAPPR